MKRTVTKYAGKVRVERDYNMEDAKDVLRYVARNRFAWPGGYTLSIFYEGGGFLGGSILCSKCARERFREEMQELKDAPEITAHIMHAAEVDPGQEFCDHCNKDLSDYAEEEE